MFVLGLAFAIFTALFCINGCLAAFLLSPENTTISVVNDAVIFKCKSTTFVNWYVDQNQIDDGYGNVDPIYPRFSINESSESYSLIIYPVIISDARIYKCSESSTAFHSSELIVLDSLPNCSYDISVCDHLTLSCYVTYHGSMPPVLDIQEPVSSYFNRSTSPAVIQLSQTLFQGSNSLNGTSPSCKVESTTNYASSCPVLFSTYIQNCSNPSPHPSTTPPTTTPPPTLNCTGDICRQLQSVVGSTTIISVICICGMVVFILQLKPSGNQSETSKFVPVYFVFVTVLILSLIIMIGCAVVIASGSLSDDTMVKQWKIGVIVMYCCICAVSIYGLIHTTVLLCKNDWDSFMKIFPIVFAVLNLLVAVATLAWTLKVMEPLITPDGGKYFSWEVFLIALGCAIVVFIPLTIIWQCYLAERILKGQEALEPNEKENIQKNSKTRRPSTASKSKVDVESPLKPDAKPNQSEKNNEGKSAPKPAPENISKPESNSASEGKNAGSPRRPLPPLNPSVPLVIKMPDQEATPRTNLPPIDPVEKTKKKKKSKKNSVDDNK